MADTPVKVHGTATTTKTTVYTVPASTKMILQGLVASNSNAAAKKLLVEIGGTRFIPNRAIPANDALVMTGMQLLVYAGETVAISGEVANDIDYRLWGLEVPA